jgi:hypothetical protein
MTHKMQQYDDLHNRTVMGSPAQGLEGVQDSQSTERLCQDEGIFWQDQYLAESAWLAEEHLPIVVPRVGPTIFCITSITMQESCFSGSDSG